MIEHWFRFCFNRGWCKVSMFPSSRKPQKLTGLLDQGRYYGAGLQKFSNHQEFQRGAMHFNLTLNKSKLTTLISDTWKNFGQGYALWIIFIFYSHFQNHICGSVFIIHVLGFCNDFLTFMIQVQINMHHLPQSFTDFCSLSST